MKKTLLTALAIVLSLFMISTTSFAHGGRTDAQGGHRDNKNVSGLGSYHYHHGYPAHLHPNGVCPYAATSTPAAAPTAPAPAPAKTTSPVTTPVASVPAPTTKVSESAAPDSKGSAVATNQTQSPEILELSAGNNTPVPSFTSTGLKTDNEKAIFLDNYIAIITKAGVYHTIDCEDFNNKKSKTFFAMDIPGALAQGYKPCPKCHK